MKKHVVIFEVQGGSDKGPDGYRKDSMPMIEALKRLGWTGEIVFYDDAAREAIFARVRESADAYVSRINPGNLKDEREYFQMLRDLVAAGVLGLPYPDAMTSYGAKDAVAKLVGTGLVPEDVYVYYSLDELRAQFPKVLGTGVRVLKQNRGSTGEGIWRVEVLAGAVQDGAVALDARLKLTEARDNHVEEKTLGEFLDFCAQYVEGEGGQLLDMPFLSRIKEGEIRVLMLLDKAVSVVHKKPAEGADAFSATLFSGAQYRYDQPDEWPELVQLVERSLPLLKEKLGGYDLPLLWTADFILDTDAGGADKYVLGEINASCVGFTTHLELADNIAAEIVKLIEKKKG